MSLVSQIVIGLVCGIALALLAPAAAVVAVLASIALPTTLVLNAPAVTGALPGNILAVLHNLLLSAVANPFKALAEANFVGILTWSSGLGIAFRHASQTTRTALLDLAEAVSKIVRMVIRFAPLGIFGLVSGTLAESGLGALAGYGRLLLVALVMNPFIVFLTMRRNPYPLVFICLRESAATAFFTRSSAANIPVNMALCKRLDLHADTYSISIPLGATINMAGAAITITVMTLAAAHTLGISVDVPTALLLCVVASLAACGVSGVAGGSLLLIPMSLSLLGRDRRPGGPVMGRRRGIFRLSGRLKFIGPVGQHQRVAHAALPVLAVGREDGRGFVDHPLVVHEQRRQRLLHQKAHAVRTVGIEDAGFAAFHAAPLHQEHDDEIDAVAVRALGRWPAHAFGGVDAELVRFDVPARHRLDLRKQPAQAGQQFAPRRRLGHGRLDRVEPAFEAAMQRVVVGRLPVRPVRCLRKRAAGKFLDEAGMAAAPVVAAIPQVRVGRQSVPGSGQVIPALLPLGRIELQDGGEISRQQQAQSVLPQSLVGGFLNGNNIEHVRYFA